MDIVAASNMDTRFLRHLLWLQRLILCPLAWVAGGVLLAWHWPLFAARLPSEWLDMKPGTAIGFLLALPGLAIGPVEPNRHRDRAARLAALAILLPAGQGLLGQGLEGVLLLDPWFGDGSQAAAGRMASQTAVFLILLTMALLSGPPRSPRRVLAAELPVLGLLALVLVISAGYVYGAVALFGKTFGSVTSPQTLLCMVLSVTALLIARVRAGYLVTLAGPDIGSRLVRYGLPLVLALPFLIIVGSVELSASGLLSPPYASALVSTLAALLLMAGLVALARRLNALVGALRRASLTDELTQLHNRRAFYLMGEQALLAARRAGRPLTVLFFDLDGLKSVNDRLGHDAGSTLLRDAAMLLRSTFRAADPVARLGGDEFAVVASASADELRPALDRLDAGVIAANAGGRPWPLSLSRGLASLGEAGPDESFDALVARADARMYEAKCLKKAARPPKESTP